MSLSAREQRILGEIARDLAGAEPRLAQALTTARLPALRRRALVSGGGMPPRPEAWIAAILASLLVGIALLTIGLALNILALAAVGTVTQFGPAALSYLWARSRRSHPAGHSY